MELLTIDREYKRGDRGYVVLLIQEWLGLHNIVVSVDGDFGPATERAVRAFQDTSQLNETGRVDQNTFSRLVAPMKGAIEEIPADKSGMGALTLAWAEQQLAARPQEVGGPNMGPWVRLYMDGQQGKEWAWCAGFVSFCLRRACSTLKTDLPFKTSFSCDELARSAVRNERFLEDHGGTKRDRLVPGSVFLVRGKTAGDWIHTGIVAGVEEETFQTIEGNTNDDGSREGYKVCKRVRAYGRCDFITLD